MDTFRNGEGKKIEVKRYIRFIDSFRFMSSGLASLVNNIPRESLENFGRYHEGEGIRVIS